MGTAAQRPGPEMIRPAVAYDYAPGRGAEHASALLSGFTGTLPVDGYAADRSLTDRARPGGQMMLAVASPTSGVATSTSPKLAMRPSPARRAVGALYVTEAEARSQTAETRRAERQTRSRPLIEELTPWLKEKRIGPPGFSRGGDRGFAGAHIHAGTVGSLSV